MPACKFSVPLVVTACLLITSASVFADDNKTAPEAARLVKVLNSNADTYAKAMACRRLAAIGDQSSVAAIAKYLSDEKLATYARSALENIPDKAAGAALQAALKNVKGNLLVGVINSIANAKTVPQPQTSHRSSLTKIRKQLSPPHMRWVPLAQNPQPKHYSPQLVKGMRKYNAKSVSPA